MGVKCWTFRSVAKWWLLVVETTGVGGVLVEGEVGVVVAVVAEISNVVSSCG